MGGQEMCCKDFPHSWTKPGPKQEYLGLGHAFRQLERGGDHLVQRLTWDCPLIAGGEHGSCSWHFGVCKTSHRPVGFCSAKGFAPRPFHRGLSSLGAATAPCAGLRVCPTGSILPHAGHRCETHPGLGDKGLTPAFLRQGQGR